MGLSSLKSNLSYYINQVAFWQKLFRFALGNAYAEMKARVIEKPEAFFERFLNLG